jgi:hypothetical protein
MGPGHPDCNAPHPYRMWDPIVTKL